MIDRCEALDLDPDGLAGPFDEGDGPGVEAPPKAQCPADAVRDLLDRRVCRKHHILAVGSGDPAGYASREWGWIGDGLPE